jgi:hypothetical protein
MFDPPNVDGMSIFVALDVLKLNRPDAGPAEHLRKCAKMLAPFSIPVLLFVLSSTFRSNPDGDGHLYLSDGLILRTPTAGPSLQDQELSPEDFTTAADAMSAMAIYHICDTPC